MRASFARSLVMLLSRGVLEEVAARHLYEKSWYEYHAVQLLDWLEKPDFVGKRNLPVWLSSAFAGALGGSSRG